MELSDEQKRRMEENRLRAINLRTQKTQLSTGSSCHLVKAQPNSSYFAKTEELKQPAALSNTTERANEHRSNGTDANENLANRTCSLPSNLPIKCSVKATCTLISNDRFQIKAAYFKPLIELFKTSKTKLYDTQTKQWTFDLSEYEFMKHELLKRLGGVVEFESLPRIACQVFVNKIKTSPARADVEEGRVDLTEVDSKIADALLPFQRTGVEFCIKNKGRLMIADDMGLGKTLQAICIAAYYRAEWPLLVITPSSVKFTWLQQLLNWLPSLDRDDITVAMKKTDNFLSGNILITSYDLAAKNQQSILKRQFKVVIIDECHLLKSNNTLRTKCITPILMKATRVIMLSGTPALSRPIELFSQLTCLDSKVFNSVHEYGLRYCSGRKTAWGWDYSSSSNLGELKIILEEKYLIRRMKKDVLQQLPKKCRTMVLLDPEQIVLDKSMKRSHTVVGKTQGKDRGHLLDYFHMTAEAKSSAVCKYVLDLLESDKKFLVFAHHQTILDSLEKLVSKSCEYIRIDGKTASEHRNFLCEKFQTNEQVRVAILSIVAANAGINLSAANFVVFAELFWNPGILIQAEDRAHRIGQQDCVNVHYLVAKNTSDDFIWALVQNKLELLSQAGISGHTFKEADTKIMTHPDQTSITSYLESTSLQDRESLLPDLTDDDFLMIGLDCDDANVGPERPVANNFSADELNGETKKRPNKESSMRDILRSKRTRNS